MGKIGYARISTDDQSLDLQLDALKLAGCDRIFEEIQSGAKRDRPILNQCLSQLTAGDVLIVWRLDRLGRSLPHLIEIVDNLKVKGVKFTSICEAINTDSAIGELFFHIFGALAQFERQLIRERCIAGMKAAQDRGVHCGRPRTADYKIEAVDQLVNIGESVASACLKVGIDRSSYYRLKQTKSDNLLRQSEP